MRCSKQKGNGKTRELETETPQRRTMRNTKLSWIVPSWVPASSESSAGTNRHVKLFFLTVRFAFLDSATTTEISNIGWLAIRFGVDGCFRSEKATDGGDSEHRRSEGNNRRSSKTTAAVTSPPAIVDGSARRHPSVSAFCTCTRISSNRIVAKTYHLGNFSLCLCQRVGDKILGIVEIAFGKCRHTFRTQAAAP